jgi:PAS domain S-box-containing protein
MNTPSLRTLVKTFLGHRNMSEPDVEPIVSDLDERMRAAEALARSEERLRLAMEATALGTFEWDIQTDRVQCSPNVKRQFGFFSTDGLTLDSVLSRIHPEDRDRVRMTIQSAMIATGSHTYAGEFRTFLPDGTSHWIDARGAVMFSELGTLPQSMVGIVLDITERKRQELRLQRSALDLGTSNRMKDEFIAMLAHKLRYPLTPIRNGLEILALTGLSDPGQRRACDIMVRHLQHLVHLVDELLDASLISRGTLGLQKELVALRPTLERAVELVRPQIEAARHELSVDIPQETLILEIDPVRIAQAIGNLLENSARYTPEQGHIILRARADGVGIVIEVVDNGPGIDPQELPHLLDLFGERKLQAPGGDRKGLGLGLALTKALVGMHGGTIVVTPAGNGPGSVFRVWLPVLPFSGPAIKGTHSTEFAPLPRRRVLIIDGAEETAEATVSMLRVMSQDVHDARNADEAITVAQVLHPEVIFLTGDDPKMDAYEITRRIRHLDLRKQPAIVALSGWLSESDEQRGREVGIDGWLTKPVDASTIACVLRDPDSYDGREPLTAQNGG